MRLGIGGCARNLDDGAVEVLACGSGDALDALERWLHHGPPAARVERVARETLPDQDMTNRGSTDQDTTDQDTTDQGTKGFSTA